MKSLKTHPLETFAILFALIFLVAVALTLATGPANASTHGVAAAYIGAGPVAFGDADPYHGDFEPAVSLSASLAPHISVVGTGAWGVCNSYLRGSGGINLCATDTDNSNFSVSAGIEYHVASKAALRPNEWCPGVSIGLVPLPDRFPRFSLVGCGWYGLTTNQSGASLKGAWRFPL